MNARVQQMMSLKPTEWQKDPANVKSHRVQYWCDGVMLTAQMDRLVARSRISSGLAYVISWQAIGELDTNGDMAG